MESLALFIANITKIFQRSILMAVEKMYFDIRIDSKNPEISEHVYNFFVVVPNDNHAPNSTSCIESQNFLISYQLLNLGSIKYSSF